MDVATMIKRKDNIVGQLTSGIKGLFKKNKVTLLPGHGKFVGQENERWLIDVNGERVEATHVIVATGSKARHLPGIPVDNKIICDNVGALSFDSTPKRLGVIGAGVIGLELGSVWKRLGSEVTILEALPDFLAAADQAVAKEAWKTFTQKQGLNIQLGVKITKVETGKKGVSVEYELGDEVRTLQCDRLIVSVGRVPQHDGLGAENVGLVLQSARLHRSRCQLPHQPAQRLGRR
jgi:dihydrolipoamide dehydrogenase